MRQFCTLAQRFGWEIDEEEYLLYFPKREFKRKALGKLLCFDGTTLFNIGKRMGMEFVVPKTVISATGGSGQASPSL